MCWEMCPFPLLFFNKGVNDPEEREQKIGIKEMGNEKEFV